MYARRYYRQTPPGYSGVAFAPNAQEAATASDKVMLSDLKNPPTPNQSKAGVNAGKQETVASPLILGGMPSPAVCVGPKAFSCEDRRYENRANPRDFSFTSQGEWENGKTQEPVSQVPTVESGAAVKDADEFCEENVCAEAAMQTGEKKENNLLRELFQASFTLEELLLLGIALLLGSKEADDDTLLLFTLIFVLLGK